MPSPRILLAALLFSNTALAGTCQPYAEKCTACRDCAKCATCNKGGQSCSVRRARDDNRPQRPLPELKR